MAHLMGPSEAISGASEAISGASEAISCASEAIAGASEAILGASVGGSAALPWRAYAPHLQCKEGARACADVVPPR